MFKIQLSKKLTIVAEYYITDVSDGLELYV